jgi:hypothetical protein
MLLHLVGAEQLGSQRQIIAVLKREGIAVEPRPETV